MGFLATNLDSLDEAWITRACKIPWASTLRAHKLLTVGRAVDCDISIDHPNVSGHHATLIVGPNGTHVLQDNGSRNGLYATSELTHRVRAIALQQDGEVFLGSHPVAVEQLVSSGRMPPLSTHSADLTQTSFDKQSRPTRLAFGLSAVAVFLILSYFWLGDSSPDTNNVSMSQTDPSSRQFDTSDEDPLGKPAIATTLEVVGPATVPDVEALPPDEPLKDTQDLPNSNDALESIYWVLLRTRRRTLGFVSAPQLPSKSTDS